MNCLGDSCIFSREKSKDFKPIDISVKERNYSDFFAEVYMTCEILESENKNIVLLLFSLIIDVNCMSVFLCRNN